MEATTGYLIWRLSTKWRTSVDRVVGPLGLTHAQFSLLGALNGLTRGGRNPSQRELADHTGMEPIYVSKLARALEKAGLVDRPADPRDPRAVRLTLTDGGREVIDQAITLVNTLQAEQLDPIGGTDSERHREFRETLLALLGDTPLTHHESEPTMTTTHTLDGRDINTAAAVTRAVLDKLLAKAGLSSDEWFTLRATALEGSTPATRISYDMTFPGLTMPATEVSVNLRRLNESGLVQSSGEQVRVTAEGRELFERVSEASKRAGEQLFEGIPQPDLEVAKRVLGKISERADRVLAEL